VHAGKYGDVLFWGNDRLHLAASGASGNITALGVAPTASL